MPYFDLPLEQLRTYRPDLADPGDLDAFWPTTLAETATHDLARDFEPGRQRARGRSTPATSRSRGSAGSTDPRLAAPASRRRHRPMPAVVEYLGYGGGRGLPHEKIAVRQRRLRPPRSWTRAARVRPGRWATRPIRTARARQPHPGFMTRGHPRPDATTTTGGCSPTPSVPSRRSGRTRAVDPRRVAVTGGSQGGGISLAVAGLVPDLAAVRPGRAVPLPLPARDRLVDDRSLHGDRPLPQGRIAITSRPHSARSPTSTARVSAGGRPHRRSSRWR